MEKKKVIVIRITEDQEKILDAKAHSSGFIRKSDYIRYLIFMPMNVDDMIKKIYDKIVKNGN